MGDKLGGKFAFLLSRTCACAPSNSDVDFLLSQVSQMGGYKASIQKKSRPEIEVFRDVFDDVEVDYRMYLLEYVQEMRSSLKYSALQCLL